MAWTDVALPLIDSGLSFLGGILTNKTNKEMTDKNVASVERMNSQNIAFQKAENALTRQREDNAVTRASIDMQNAGLSKTLAAGHPASAQALTAPSTQAPNYSYKYENALMKLQLADSIANFKLKQSEANKNNAQASTVAKQSELYDSQIGLNKANEKLTSIVGENKQREIDTQISYYMQQIAESKSRVSLNQEQILKLSYDITKTIAETEHLGFQTQMLLYQIVGQRLSNLTNAWNLSRFIGYGTPTNFTPSKAGQFAKEALGAFGGFFDSSTKVFSNELNDIFGY